MQSYMAGEHLQKSCLPRPPDEVLTDLEAPLSGDEVALAMACMQTSRAPGPDGYSLLYYKTFVDLLTLHFLTAYNATGEGVIPPGGHVAGLHYDNP